MFAHVLLVGFPIEHEQMGYYISGYLYRFCSRVVVHMDNEVSPVNRVDTIQTELANMVGQRIRVRANMGRSRIVERLGTLLQTYPALFVVEVEERRGRKARQSYQYVDVLTGTVELYDPKTGERLLNFTVEE